MRRRSTSPCARCPIRTIASCSASTSRLYFSVHTPAARLGDGGSRRGRGPALVRRHVTTIPRPRLEALLDRAQPGWRNEVVDDRYGRRLVVAHGRPLPGSGFAGARRRPCPTSAGPLRGRRLGRPRRVPHRRGAGQRASRRRGAAAEARSTHRVQRVNAPEHGRRRVRGAPAPALRHRVPHDRERERRRGRVSGRVVALGSASTATKSRTPRRTWCASVTRLALDRLQSAHHRQ